LLRALGSTPPNVWERKGTDTQKGDEQNVIWILIIKVMKKT
jgi:hypothetical protein